MRNSNSLRNLKRGGSPGRPKGVPNKITVEARDLAQKLLDDPKYADGFKKRLLAGELAPALESMVWHYAYGKPIERLEVDAPEPVQVISHFYGVSSTNV
jgi:hypothetical protein